MKHLNIRKVALLISLLLVPMLALAVPNITSITPSKTAANTGSYVYIYGTGFGSLSDLVYFPDGTEDHVVNPDLVIAGGVRVRVPPTWSGDVQIQANGSGTLSNGVNHEISYNYSGEKWNSLPFTWYLNSAGAPGCSFTDTRDALVNGYHTWECASGLTTTYGGSTSTSTTANDGENVRYWKNTGWSPGTIAVASWWFYPGDIIEADIAFNSQYFTWSCSGAADDMDVQNIGTHEEGHTIGLLDLYGAADSEETMYGWSADGVTTARTLRPDDVYGAEYMYSHSRANFYHTTPSGWTSSLVPRNTSDGSSTYAPLPTILNGNTNTYINFAGINNGSDCASPSGLNHIFIDDSYVWWNSWGGVWGPGVTVTWPNSGPYIRGGRHTLRVDQDTNNETVESNESDNSRTSQYVWSPYLLANQTPVYRSAPPVRGSLTYPNCDGFEFSTGGTWWGCVGIIPNNSSDDYDLRLHNESPTSTNGFDTYEASSAWGAGSSDFVLVNGNNGGGSTINRWVGANRYSGNTSGLYVQLSENIGTLSAPVTTATMTIHANDIVSMHEIYLGTATSWDFILNNLSGSANLGFAIYDAVGTHFAKSSYAMYANSNGSGLDESFTYVAPAAGYYGMVVFKTGTADLGDLNTYQLDIQLTPPNLTPITPTGWDGPVVLRNDNTASGGDVHVSASLDGNVNNTYMNLSGINDGPNSAAFNHSRFYLDTTYIRWIDWGVVNAGQAYQYFNGGAHNVRGGRHMVEWRNDWDDEIIELDEGDNDHIQQYVWSPYGLTDQLPVVRNAPPPKGSIEGFLYPNCDGFEFTWGEYWGAVGSLPESSSADYDVRLHNDPVTPTNGFDAYDKWSTWGSGHSDFVLVNGNNAGGSTGTRQAGIINYNTGSGNVAVQQSNRVGLLSAPGTFAANALTNDMVLQVFEVYFGTSTLGTYIFELDQLTGTTNLGVSLYDQSGLYYAKQDYIGYSNSGGSGADESFVYNITTAGYYGVVVWKSDSADYGLASTYDLNIAPAPPNLVPYAATGWDYPVVARNDNTATNGNAHVSPVLDGNTNNTYLSQSGMNDGANSAAQNNTRYYVDGVYVWWVNYGAIGSGAYYSATNSGPQAMRGGRHTILWENDWDDMVVESNEADNDYSRQYVWSPQVLADETPLARGTPPERGTGTYPNSDGFAYTGVSGFAWVTAICPQNSTDDYDLYMYTDYVGAESGFSLYWEGSGALSGLLDFVGGPYSTSGIPYYPAAVFYSGGTSGYVIDTANSSVGHLASAPPVLWPSETLPPNRLVDVFEVSLTASAVFPITLTNVSGGSDLAVTAFPPSTPSLNWFNAEEYWNTGGAGADETALFVPLETGWYVFVVQKLGSADIMDNVVYDFGVDDEVTGVDDEDLPTAFALQGNTPNPFNPATTISYEIPQPGSHVSLVIFDLTGKHIRTLVSENQVAGSRKVMWDGRSDSGEQMPSGTYFYRLQAGQFSKTEKMMLIK